MGEQQQGEDELPVLVVDNNSPSTCDVPLGGSHHGKTDTDTSTNQQQPLSQTQTRTRRGDELPIIHDLGHVDDEKDFTKRSTKCYITNARTLCTIFTLLFIFLTGMGVGFAIFPTTRHLSLIVFLPLMVVSFLSCLTTICIISVFEDADSGADGDDDGYDDDDAKEKRLVVIEPTDLPAPTPKKKNHCVYHDNDTNNNNNDDDECCIEGGGNHTVASTLSESMEENNNKEANLLESTLPEVHEFIQSTQKSFDEATNYVISKIVRPAATFCRPTSSTNANTNANTNMSTSGGLGLAGCRSAESALNSSISRNNSSNNNNTNNNTSNRISTSTSTINTNANQCPDDIECLRDENGIINLSGTYKLIHNENFDLFLKALNIPSLFRRAVCLARPVHTYTHDTQTNTFRVQIDGIIKGDSLFKIYGTPSLSYMRHYVFLDHVSYNDDKSGVVVRKEFQDSGKKSNANMAGSVLFVERTLFQGGKKLILSSTAVQADGSVVAVSKQTFLRI